MSIDRIKYDKKEEENEKILHLNRWAKNTEPTPIRAYAHKYSKIPGLLNFTVGEPDFDTPTFIIKSLKEALNKGDTHYGPTAGLPELKEAIARHFKRRQGLDLNPEQIIITVGAAEAIQVSSACLIDEGDQVIVPSPAYPVYRSNIALSGGQVFYLDTSKTNLKLSPPDLDKTLRKNPKAKVLLFNYPTNPTGVTYDKEEIKALAQVIKEHDIMVISDEIYGEFTFNGNSHYSLYNEIPDQIILISGTSKSFAMTGFRLGFMHVPKAYYDKLFDVHQVTVTCAPTFIQEAAITAYDKGDRAIDYMKDEYNMRKNILMDALPDIGLDPGNPEGAFYAFPSIPKSYENDDRKFCDDLAENAKVGVLPGSIFGPGGQGHFRLSYAANADDLKEGFDRMANFVKKVS